MTTPKTETNPHKLPEHCDGAGCIVRLAQLPTSHVAHGRCYCSQENIDAVYAWARWDYDRRRVCELCSGGKTQWRCDPCRRFASLSGDSLRTDAEDAEIHATRERLAAMGVDPGWEIVARHGKGEAKS